MTHAVLKRKKTRIQAIARRHGIKRIRVFGSVARNEATKNSDVDLLVDIAPGRSYLDLVGFWQDVEELLGRKVDVVTDGGLHPALKDRIYSEAVKL